MQDFKKKTEVITGGAGGIGIALAEHLVARGATVVLADRDLFRVQEAAARIDSGRVIPIRIVRKLACD